ncbi:Tripartite motif-containing 13, partial [Clarias magur]
FTHTECWSSVSDGLQKFEESTVILEELVLKVNENSTWKLPYKCCMCKESVMLARFLVINEIQQ